MLMSSLKGLTGDFFPANLLALQINLKGKEMTLRSLRLYPLGSFPSGSTPRALPLGLYPSGSTPRALPLGLYLLGSTSWALPLGLYSLGLSHGMHSLSITFLLFTWATDFTTKGFMSERDSRKWSEVTQRLLWIKLK